MKSLFQPISIGEMQTIIPSDKQAKDIQVSLHVVVHIIIIFHIEMYHEFKNVLGAGYVMIF
jgi:hypothetical protein